MKISVVIPTHDRVGLLVQLLPHLVQQAQGDGAEIILVDDGSPESYAPQLESAGLLKHVRYIRSENNLGAACARNVGVEEASGDLLVFIDDDIEVADGFLHLHRAAHADGDRKLVVGTQVIPERLILGSYGRYRAHKEAAYQPIGGSEGPVMVPSSGVTTANLSIRKEDFTRLGAFSERERDLSCQDYEFGWRARQAGYPIYRHLGIRAYHYDVNVTVEKYLRRQYKFAYSHVRLRSLNPSIADDPMLASEFRIRGPISPDDRPGRRMKKLAFRVLASLPSSASLRVSAQLADLLNLPAPLSFWLYDIALEAWYQRGYLAGLRDFPEAH